MTEQCGAKTRKGTPCKQKPVKGNARCKLHGGHAGRPVLTGRYSKLKHKDLGDLIQRHGECEEELSLAAELAALRAIFEMYVNNSEATIEGEEVDTFDEDRATRLLDAIGRMVKRVEDVKAANAISEKDFFRLTEQMALSVKAHVPDEEAREKIAKEWRTMKY